MSKRIGRPEERKKDGGPVSQWISWDIINIYRISSHLIWAWFMVPQNNYNSNIKDHWSHITITDIIIMKKFKYHKNYWNMTQRHEVNKCWWKMAPTDLLNAELPHTFSLENMQYLQSAINEGCLYIKWCNSHSSSIRQKHYYSSFCRRRNRQRDVS